MNDEPDIHTIRKGLRLTQEQMAERLGIDRSSVSHMENGRPPRGPTRKLLDALAQQMESESPVVPAEHPAAEPEVAT